ncbi:MAG TPA: TetR/AcrR family transcriptional regulator [Ktedonobacterales bacterium]|nr:TetR/AcrR family transcriptional regulator [Ktedonobacterales bacterium]
MSKGEQTHQMIVERAASFFSRYGYFGSSIDDLMQETGLKKGGIYNHFRSKDELALEAFDYAIKLTWSYIEREISGKTNARDRLHAMLVGYRRLIEELPLPGGCPLLNTAVEADDAHPALRQRAQQAMTNWRTWIARTVARGIAAGEIRPETDGNMLATIIISTVEGAVMMSKLYGDTIHIQRAVDYLATYLDTTIRL